MERCRSIGKVQKVEQAIDKEYRRWRKVQRKEVERGSDKEGGQRRRDTRGPAKKAVRTPLRMRPRVA